jgi:iron complex transport system substrate-binding protein
MKGTAWLVGALFGFNTCGAAWAATYEAIDANGTRVTLTKPAQRIVSLSPHATELIDAAGAGGRLVAVTQACDFPPRVQSLPQISNAQGVNFEALIAAKPDLVVVWPAGNRAQDLERLRSLNIPLFASQPTTLASIADDIEKLGALAGTSPIARTAAAQVRARIRSLSEVRSQPAEKTRVFYQLGPGALYTLNDAHPVMEVIARCGGRNIYGHLPQSAPQVSIESVLGAKPEVIVFAEPKEAKAMQAQWSARGLKHARFQVADGHLLHRPTPRLFEAAQALCHALRDNRMQ